jgi:hypothetical protein
MDSPDSTPRPLHRRALPWLGGGALVLLLVVGLVAPEHAIGPVGAALTGVPGPWPADWQALLAAPNSRPLGMESATALRCPEDPVTGDPLAQPSFVLITGLDRDMPPQLVACHERACFHIRSGRGNVEYALLYFVTLGGDVDSFAAPISGRLPEAAARAAVERSMASLAAQDRSGIALAGRRGAVAAKDAEAIRVLRESLQARNHRLRLCAAWTAGAAGNRDLVPSLRNALGREPDLQVREELARSLALLGDRSGLPLLLAAFEAPPRWRGHGPSEPASDAERRARAHRGLTALAGEDLGGLFDPAAAGAWQAWAAGRKAQPK